jgi:disulfide bond formation protein DsbB
MSNRQLFAGMAVLCLAALAAALTSQHVFGMQPCPWCVLQRLIFVLIALAAGAGAWLAAAAASARRRVAARIAAAAAATFGLAGMAAALWQHFVAASSASCDLTLADRIMSASGLDMAWPEVFAPFASCADAHVKLLGISYELYSLTLFALLVATAVVALRRP